MTLHNNIRRAFLQTKLWLDLPFLNATDTMDFQDYGYVCHLNENMILTKLSDDEVKPLDVPESCKCTICVKRTCRVAGLEYSVLYSVDVQIMRIKDVKIPTQQGQHKLYLPCCVLYHALAVSLYIMIMSRYIMYIFQLLFILSYCNIVWY